MKRMNALSAANEITLSIDDREVRVPAGTSVAAALMQAGVVCRTSVAGEPRTALCGMGICMECRAMIDGVAHARTCQVMVRDGMKVVTA